MGYDIITCFVLQLITEQFEVESIWRSGTLAHKRIFNTYLSTNSKIQRGNQFVLSLVEILVEEKKYILCCRTAEGN